MLIASSAFSSYSSPGYWAISHYGKRKRNSKRTILIKSFYALSIDSVAFGGERVTEYNQSSFASLEMGKRCGEIYVSLSFSIGKSPLKRPSKEKFHFVFFSDERG